MCRRPFAATAASPEHNTYNQYLFIRAHARSVSEIPNTSASAIDHTPTTSDENVLLHSRNPTSQLIHKTNPSAATLPMRHHTYRKLPKFKSHKKVAQCEIGAPAESNLDRQRSVRTHVWLALSYGGSSHDTPSSVAEAQSSPHPLRFTLPPAEESTGVEATCAS